jgi:hypothetical protein
MVASVNASNSLLSDADAGLPFHIDITFDDAMNTGVDPVIQFTSPIASLIANPATSNWINANTYSASFDFTDDNVEISNIVIEISGATDDSGNEQNIINYYFNAFEIDSRNPQVSSLTTSTSLVNSGDIGSGTFAITVDFDEAMDQSQTPVLSLSGTASSSLVFSASSGWNSAYSYTARYDVLNADASMTGVDVALTPGATDVAGNAAVTVGYEDVFDIDVIASVDYESVVASWNIYPNPVVSGQLLRIAAGHDESGTLSIIDPTGRLMHQTKFNHARTLDVSTENWSAGVYFMRMKTEAGESMCKIIVE